jgi:hypothetical protein
MAASGTVQAQEVRRVQEITGQVELKERPFYYTLPNLQKGQTLYVFMQGTSNSLDPFVALLKPGADVTTLRQDYLKEEKRLVDAGRRVGKTWDIISINETGHLREMMRGAYADF